MQENEMHARRLPDEHAAREIELRVGERTQQLSLANDQLRQELLDQQQARRELEHAREAAVRASLAKSEFLASMSHELRTPLNAIIGFSDVLKEQIFGPLNESQVQYVTDILEGGQQLLALLNDILDLAKLESGALEVEWHETDLEGTVARALQMVQERALRAGVQLSSEISIEHPMVRADGRRLRQLLLNLLAIALKAAPAGGSVAVRLRAAADGVQLSVADSGAAFAAAEQAQLPQSPDPMDFRRVKAEPELCLGLALVGQIAHLHGGRTWSENQPGRGSEFFVWLPDAPSASQADVPTSDCLHAPLVAAAAGAATAIGYGSAP